MSAVVVEAGVPQRLSPYSNGHRGANLVAMDDISLPGEHVVNKSNGQDLVIRWSCRNNGNAIGKAILDLRFVAPGQSSGRQVAQTIPVQISPGLTAPLILFWPVSSPVGQGGVGVIIMWDFTRNLFDNQLGSHVFTINVVS